MEDYSGDGSDWTAASSEVTTCDLSTGFEITKDDSDATWLPEKRVNYRVKYEVPDSLLSEDEGKVVYDYFTVRYHHKCADLTVAISGDDLADYTYLVKTGAASVAFTPNFVLTNDDSCALTTTYENREYGTATWWTPSDNISSNSAPYDFNTFLTESGTFTLDVQYTTAATFNPAVVFEIRITYAITDPTHAISASASETFLLTMKDACLDNKITCDMAAIDWTHTI